jgi:hypothetical protein
MKWSRENRHSGTVMHGKSFNGSSTVADQKENLKLFNWLKSLKAT